VKTVERPRQEAYVVWELRINKPNGLLAVHRLLKVAVEEDVGDVELMSQPVVRRHERENGADRGWLDHRRERLAKVEVGPLIEPHEQPIEPYSTLGCRRDSSCA
jgi:hypothetical protein